MSQREGHRRPGARITTAIIAAERAGRTVDAGGPLGPKHEYLDGAIHEVAECPACHTRYLTAVGINCPGCGEPYEGFRDYEATKRRPVGIHAAEWALRHSRSDAQAADTLIELLWELGLLPDPLCKWEPRTITDRWTSRRRQDGGAA